MSRIDIGLLGNLLERVKSAKYLGRPKAELYIVHSFRRTTAASKMVENGATILEIMLGGGWKSDKIARTYVEKSLRTKVIFYT